MALLVQRGDGPWEPLTVAPMQFVPDEDRFGLAIECSYSSSQRDLYCRATSFSSRLLTVFQATRAEVPSLDVTCPSFPLPVRGYRANYQLSSSFPGVFDDYNYVLTNGRLGTQTRYRIPTDLPFDLPPGEIQIQDGSCEFVLDPPDPACQFADSCEVTCAPQM
jgi:hypothetical protein